MNQDQIAQMFRVAELERRAQRLQALTKNAKALLHEPLTAKDEFITKKAIDQLHAASLATDRVIYPGYWKRLWAALLNR